MKHPSLILCAVLSVTISATMLLCSCNQNEPTKGGSDTASLNQPDNPKDWSPVGHKYISTDKDYPDREITFISRDSFIWKREELIKTCFYDVYYPTITILDIRNDKWIKFTDTLTITRLSNLADEASTYKLVY